ncbi:hypothetical protein FQN50_000139 [Emmonsiellopsis sp. PD_5]|nr:hypothetical protein FQN50_000139 [Emmonsiellopsis sp. PD_5]
MPLSDLPTELILMIGDAQTSLSRPPFANDVCSLSALAQTCRRFHKILNPYLYRFNARYQGSSALVWAVRNARRRTAEIALDNKADVHVSLDKRGFPVDSKTRQPGLRPDIPSHHYWFYPPCRLTNSGLLTQAFMELERLCYTEATESYAGTNIPCADMVAKYNPVIELLIDRGIDIERADIECQSINEWSVRLTTLHRAAHGGYDTLVQLLLDKGANVDSLVARSNYTPLFYAVQNDYDCFNKTPEGDPWKLQWATRKQRVVRMLLARGADVNARACNGSTPLHYAVYCPSLVRILLGYGADATAGISDDGTPLHRAIYHLPCGPPSFNCHREHRRVNTAIKSTIRVLLEHGAAVDERDKGTTALHLASRYLEMEVAQILLEFGANVNARGPDGWSPIQYALHASAGEFNSRALANARTISRMLIGFGANVNSKTEMGLAPLHQAAAYGDLELVRALIDHGAVVQERDVYGFSPLQYAVEGLNGTLGKYARRFPYVSGRGVSYERRFAIPSCYEGVANFLLLYEGSRLLTE